MTDKLCAYAGDRGEAIVAYLYGESTPAERSAFESHVAACAECRAELAALGDVRERLAQWSPPSLQPALTGRPPGDAVPASGSRSFWREMPAWAQAAAALLVLGVSAGAANLSVTHDASGITVSTGWMQPHAAASATIGQAAGGATAGGAASAPWLKDLETLASELRAERATAIRTVVDRTAPQAQAAAPGDDRTDLLRRVRALIEESEKKQESELALRVAQVARDAHAERLADLSKIDRTLGLLQSNTGFEVARQREMINSLAVRVSQTQTR